MVFYILFCANVVYYEVNAAYAFCRNRNDSGGNGWFAIVRQCVMLRQKHNYSGVRLTSYVARSLLSSTEDTEDINQALIYEETKKVSFNFWTRITQSYLSRMYTTLETPTRLYTMNDVQDYRPFLTRNTWSLERVFCRPKRSRYIAIIKGPGSLTRSQFRSSFVCSLIGTALIVLIFISVLVWFHLSGIFVLLAFIVVVIAAAHSLRGTFALYKLYRDLSDVRTLKKEGKDDVTDDDEVEADGERGDRGDEEAKDMPPPTTLRTKSLLVWNKAGKVPSEGVFLVEDYVRVTEPSDRMCYVFLVLEAIIFYVYPAGTLLYVSWNVGVLFVVVALISGIRHYVNAAVVIEETGNMELVGGSTPEKKWTRQSRLNTIVTSITVSKSKRLWLAILGGKSDS